MGCGFSTEDTKASDEERILNSTNPVTSATNTTTRMGGALAKKSPAKKRRGDNKGKATEQGDPSPPPLIINCCRWTSVLNKVAAAPTRPKRHYPYCLPLPTTILLLLSRSYYTHNFTPITLKQLDRAISVSYKCVQLYRAYTLYPIIERLYHYKVFFTIQTYM